MGLWNTIKAGLATAITAVSITPAAAEEAPLHTQLETDNPQIAECAGEAFDAVKIDGARAYYNEAFNSLVQRRSEEFASNSELNPIKVNGVGTIVDVFESGTVSFQAYHDGTLSDEIDSIKTAITIEFDQDIVISRKGIIIPDGFNMSQDEALTAPHGAWTAAAAQTMEHVFVECMNIENPDRISRAATTVGQPPAFMPATQ